MRYHSEVLLHISRVAAGLFYISKYKTHQAAIIVSSVKHIHSRIAAL